MNGYGQHTWEAALLAVWVHGLHRGVGFIRRYRAIYPFLDLLVLDNFKDISINPFDASLCDWHVMYIDIYKVWRYVCKAVLWRRLIFSFSTYS